MKQIVEFELLSDVICGGVRTADKFFESEPFIRGSVLRAAFAKEILLSCPLSGQPSKDGKLNFIEIKDAEGKCSSCSYKKVCGNFSGMSFSYAYKTGTFPAPFTVKVCKKSGTEHRIEDTLIEKGAVACDDCKGRMERLKGYISLCGEADERRVKAEITEMSVSAHTAIHSYSGTSKHGSVFSVKAIRKGQHFNAVIDDCGSGMLYEGAVIYAGKYSSSGYGKMKIASITPFEEITEAIVKKRIEKFNHRFRTENKAAILCVSDICIDSEEEASVCDAQSYKKIWEKALFGEKELPFSIDTVFAETKLYSGYDTSKKWGCWKSNKPEFLILKGTSILITIKEGRFCEAVELLTKLQKNGIGKKCADGYGQIEICHSIHFLGVTERTQQ